MGHIYKPWIFSGSFPIAHTWANENFQKIFDEFDGNIDDSNIKASAAIAGSKFRDGTILGRKIVGRGIVDGSLDYASPNGLRVVRMGPNITADGLRLASGAKAFTMNTLQTEIVVLIIFAVDSDYGDPIFHAAPRPVIDGVQIDNGDSTTHLNTRVESVSATRMLVTISASAAPATTIGGFLLWQAFGGV